MVLVLLSCGREPATGPQRTPGGVARGLSFNALFPAMPNLAAFASLIDFNRVRVVLRHADGSVALDTMVAFPAGTDAITLSFDVPLAAGTPAAGELLALNLRYVNAAGDTVFRGGPVQLRAAVAIEGAPPPPPVTIPVVYSGPGASAKTIKISPRTLTVNAGQPFVFTSVASDSIGAAVPIAPVAWFTPDPTLANIPVPTSGAGTANAARGTARIIAQLIGGASDTVSLNIIPVATAVGVASGNNQSGVIGKPAKQVLAQPIVVRVTAGDGLGVGGVSVSFAAANGGSVSPTTIVTDAAGLAQTTWSLGTSDAAQTATATVAGLTGSPVTFNATAAAKPATKLVLTSGPAVGADIPSGTLTPLVVAAQDVDGDPALGFTGDITVALSANPAGGALAGKTTVAATGGTASFAGISIAKPGTGYVLQATSGSLTPASTNAFNIVTGPAANLTLVSGGGQTAEAGGSLLPIIVLVTDANANPKSGATVAFAPGATFGVAAPTSTVTGVDGTATVVWTLGTPVGAQTLAASTAGVAPLTVAATAVAVVRQWVITQQPASALVAGVAIAPAITAELRDAFNKLVPSYVSPTAIALVNNAGGSTLGGTLTVNAVAGIATFPGLSLNKVGSGYTLGVTATATTQGTTNAFTVTPAAAAALTIVSGSAQTGATGAALAQPVVAKLTDSFGNPVAATAVAVAVSTGGGSVTPATGNTNAAGEFSTVWTLGSATAAQSLSITSTGVAAVTATATATSATRVLVVTQQPGASQVAGVAITPAVTVEMRDGFGALVPSFTGPATIALGANPGGATLGGTLTVNAVAGVATFPGLTLNKSGTGYTLVAAASGATSGTTSAFAVTSAAAASLAIVSGNAQTGATGAALAQPVVAKLTDSFGNPVAATAVAVAVSTGGGSVTPATGNTNAAGEFSTVWTLGSATAAQSLSITSTGVAAVTATATATSATRVLVVTQQPGASQVAGVAITPAVTVEMRDGFNTLVPSFTGAVAIAMGSNTGGSTIAGTPTVNAVAGVASFPGISLDKRGGGYTLVASSLGATSATTTSFVVSAAAAKSIAVTSGNAQGGTAGTALANPLVAFVTDAFGNGVAATPVSISVRTGGGSVTPTSGVTDSTGRVSATWTLGSGATAQSLQFALTGVDSTTATATVLGGNAWVITTQPGATQTAGATITPGPVAELRDGVGAVVTTFNGSVTLSLASNPAGGTLAGTTVVSAANGIVTFSNTSISKAGAYSFGIASTGATAATSSAFTVVAAAASSVSVESGGSQAGTFGAMLAAPVVLKVADAFGNPVSGTAVSFAVTSGGGSVGTPSAMTDASGRVSTTWTLGPSGTQTISGTATGLTGSPLTISATTASGSVAQTIVTPRTDTLTSLGATRALTVQARDVASNIVAGSFSWVSRDPSIATVSSGGVVTAIANGSIYVVATEIGGTRDSALMVVQQRIASVNITPGSRSLYVTGTFAYSALAVDGRGNAMAAQPTFTWTSTAPSVASVNASTGAVSALTIGSTQIRATSGAIVGVSNLGVLTPITRIDVTFDSASAAAPDTFTMTALGLRRAYRAIARDTLLNVMSGVTFTWSSSNPSVAAIDAPAATTAGAISAANGVTSIQASAQGATGKATLFVAQVLSSIVVTPASISVGVSGSTTMLARGKDSQGRYISGGTFSYASSNGAFVTIDASTGVATGVAIGSANITATSGAITSSIAVVTVSSTAAPIISFGRDTIGVGRGSSTSVPILLSRPNATPLIVKLAAADTNAYWSTATVTVPANATSVNATLIGRNAGSTRVTAVDSSGAGYAPATAVVAVQANINMAAGYYSINATDGVPTQVLLSDPSPVGGTYVTFSYGTSGKASASPDPAFIPAGQLAADVVIRGLAAGTTTITPVATGVNGTAATINVSAAVISLSTTTLRLGIGQYEPYQYVYTPISVLNPLAVKLGNSDSTVAITVPSPSVTIPANSNIAYFQVNAVAPGTATITPSATGWTASNTLAVTTTTPKLILCCAYTINSSLPSQSMTLYVADSVGNTHYRVNSLSVRMSSSDTSVLKVLDTLGTVAAGSYYLTSMRVSPAGPGGSAWIKITAGGHVPDSVKITVIGPALTLSYTSLRVGAGQKAQNQYVSIPNAIAKPFTIRLTNSDSTIAATDTLLTIPTGYTYAYFDVRGRSTGTSTVIASAPGYIPDTASNTVTTPKVYFAGATTLNAYQLYSQYVYVGDSLRNVNNRITSLPLSFRSSDPTILTIDTTATVPANSYYANVNVNALKPGTAIIYVTAPGHTPDSVTMTVQPAKLNLSFSTAVIGARQTQFTNSYYAYTPNSRPVPVVVTFSHSNPAALTVTPTVDTIPANSNIAYFGFSGLTTGVDTIIATATGYDPATAVVLVSTPKLLAYLPSSATTTTPPGTATIYAADSLGSVHYVSDSLVVRAVSSDTNVIRPTQQYFRIPKGSYYANPQVQYVGPGTATMTYSDSAGLGYLPATSGTVTVVGPSLGIAGASQGKLGTGQHTGPYDYYVYIPNALGTPLTVNLVSTDPRVATLPASVTIAAGATYQYFRITAQDTIGTVQIQTTATGYTAASVNMKVTPPKFVLGASSSLFTTSPSSTFYVYAADEDGSVHYVNQDLVVRLGTSAPGIATIDSTFVTIVADAYYSYKPKWSPGSVGTAQLSASDARAIMFPYATATQTVTVSTPPAYLALTSLSLAPGQYTTGNYVGLQNAVTGSTLTVPLSHSAIPRTNTPASVDIGVGSAYAYFRIDGTSVGTDTITASPAGNIPASGIVVVGLGLIDNNSGWPTALKVGDSTQVTMYTRSPSGSAAYVSAATVFTLSPASNVRFVSGGAAGSSVVITSVTVPIDQYYTTFWVKGVSTGTGSSSISNANYVTYTNTVTVNP